MSNKHILTATFLTIMNIGGNVAQADDKSTGIIGTDFKMFNDTFATGIVGDRRDRHDTGSVSFAAGYQLSDSMIATGSIASTLYAPYDISRRQQADEPTYSGWGSVRFGLQYSLPYNIQVGGAVGYDRVSDLSERVQTAVHELIDLDVPSDDLRRQEHGMYFAYDLNAETQIPVGMFTIQPHMRIQGGYMDTASSGIRLHFGAVPTTIGYERATGAVYSVNTSRLGQTWHGSIGIEETFQFDVPHLEPAGTMRSFTTLSTEVTLPVSEHVGMVFNITHMDNKYENQAEYGKDPKQTTAGFAVRLTF